MSNLTTCPVCQDIVDLRWSHGCAGHNARAIEYLRAECERLTLERDELLDKASAAFHANEQLWVDGCMAKDRAEKAERELDLMLEGRADRCSACGNATHHPVHYDGGHAFVPPSTTDRKAT